MLEGSRCWVIGSSLTAGGLYKAQEQSQNVGDKQVWGQLAMVKLTAQVSMWRGGGCELGCSRLARPKFDMESEITTKCLEC